MSDSYVVRLSVQHDVVHNITMLGTQFIATKTRADAEYFLSYSKFYNQQHDHVPHNKTSKDCFFENPTLPVAILTVQFAVTFKFPLQREFLCETQVYCVFLPVICSHFTFVRTAATEAQFWHGEFVVRKIYLSDFSNVVMSTSAVLYYTRHVSASQHLHMVAY